MKGAREKGRGRKIKNFDLPDKRSKTFYHMKKYKRESSCTPVFRMTFVSFQRKEGNKESNPDLEFSYTLSVSDIYAFSLADWTFPVD